MTEIGAKLIKAIRYEAKKNPEKITGKGDCVYVKDGRPGCLVGAGMWAAGLIDRFFEDDNRNKEEFTLILQNNFPDTGQVQDESEYVYNLFNEPIDWKEVEWINFVQDFQDDQQPWAEAVSEADRRTE